MTIQAEQAVLTADNDTPGQDRVTVALHGLAVLLARAHVREIANASPANEANVPTSALRGGGL